VEEAQDKKSTMFIHLESLRLVWWDGLLVALMVV